MNKSKLAEELIKGIFSKKNKFLPGSELISLLSKKLDINSSYARKLISRSVGKGLINSSKPFTFKNGQYVYMGIDDKLDLKTLMEISRKYKPPMYRILSLLEREGGVLSFYEARKIAATPVDNIDKYKRIKFDEEIGSLLKYEIISSKVDEKNISYIINNDLKNNVILNGKIRQHYDFMRIDSIFVPDILAWLRTHNFITSERPIYRRIDNPSIGAKHNDVLWDAFAYTNTTGFSVKVGSVDKQTLIAMDILVHREYSKVDLDGFYERLQFFRHSTRSENVRKVMPIIFYLDMQESVKKEIKKLNILCFSLNSIFGKNIEKLIRNIEQIQSDLSQTEYSEGNSISVIENINDALKLVEDTGHIDNIQNLKGDLFESLMYTIIKSMFSGEDNSIVIHSKIINPYEYDVMVQLADELIIFELKGYKNTTIINLGPYDEKNTVKWFFNNTFCHAKKSIENDSFLGLDRTKIKACYITSAKFSKEAESWLEDNMNGGSNKPSNLDCYYDGEKLLALLKKQDSLASIRKSTGFINILEKYYLR